MSTKPPKPKVNKASASNGISTWLMTANYSQLNKRPDLTAFVPVRTSRGAPRFPLRYSEAMLVSEAVKPPADTFGLDREPFERRYRRHLNDQGLHAIAAELAELHNANGNKPLALLCFCKLDEGQFCHRRIFADWWREQTGEGLLEITLTHPRIAT